jgi:hypothetical protein
VDAHGIRLRPHRVGVRLGQTGASAALPGRAKSA